MTKIRRHFAAQKSRNEKDSLIKATSETVQHLANNNSLAYEPSLHHVVDQYRDQSNRALKYTLAKKARY